MFYTMHHGIVVSKFVENNLNYGVGAQLGRRSSSLLGTGLTGLLYRSDRLSPDRDPYVVFKRSNFGDFSHESDISCG